MILAIPRGGLPLGAIVAKSLNAKLDVALSKKIGHPFNKEFAIGAVSLNNIILDDNVEISIGYIEKEKKRLREKLKKRNAASYVDEVVCLETPFNFQAVGQFYMDFDQVSDEEAIKILEEFNA